MTTLEYYDKNSEKLIEKYSSADVTEIHNLFKKHIMPNSAVLDIGFGSGRDMDFIKNNITENVFGLDGSAEFVNHMKNNTFYGDRVSRSVLPVIDVSELKVKKFDTVIMIAVLMHFNASEILETLLNIKKILKTGGRVIISYSTGSRSDDERRFYEMSMEEVSRMFNENGFSVMEKIVNKDSLERSLEWVTQVFRLS